MWWRAMLLARGAAATVSAEQIPNTPHKLKTPQNTIDAPVLAQTLNQKKSNRQCKRTKTDREREDEGRRAGGSSITHGELASNQKQEE